MKLNEINKYNKILKLKKKNHLTIVAHITSNLPFESPFSGM